MSEGVCRSHSCGLAALPSRHALSESSNASLILESPGRGLRLDRHAAGACGQRQIHRFRPRLRKRQLQADRIRPVDRADPGRGIGRRLPDELQQRTDVRSPIVSICFSTSRSARPTPTTAPRERRTSSPTTAHTPTSAVCTRPPASSTTAVEGSGIPDRRLGDRLRNPARSLQPEQWRGDVPAAAAPIRQAR